MFEQITYGHVLLVLVVLLLCNYYSRESYVQTMGETVQTTQSAVRCTSRNVPNAVFLD